MPILSRRSVLFGGAGSALIATLGVAGVGAGTKQTPVPVPPVAPLWTDDERKAIVAYWNAPGRYVVEEKPADLMPRVNITVRGSEWYWNFSPALSALRKMNPAQAEAWEKAFGQRLQYDRYQADKTHNLVFGQTTIPTPMPDDLETKWGTVPSFYEDVQPRRYTVTFATEDAAAPFIYTDNLSFTNPKPYYGYYRSTNGVRKFGKRLSAMSVPEKAEVAALFAGVASSPFEQHVLAAVSALEGGFDAVNTYDTGWVSIGFIQFITKRDGSGSLSSVLAQHKRADPQDFAKTFHRFGIDVDASGVLAVCAPTAGNELHGKDAVDAVINDKRLTAVWERAGSLTGFRKAQVMVARQQYWPGDDTVTVVRQTLNEQRGSSPATVKGIYYAPPGNDVSLPPEVQALFAAVPEKQKTDATYQLSFQTDVLTAKVSDLVKSEAGMATLMDRKVNRGNLGNLNELAAKLMQDNKLTNLADVSRYEKSLIEGMKYRANYLTNPTLTQPAAPPQPAP